jgi:hypothetical protein
MRAMSIGQPLVLTSRASPLPPKINPFAFGASAPGWLPDLAEALGGYQLNSQGALEFATEPIIPLI